MKKKGCLAGCLAVPVVLLLVGLYVWQRARTAPQVGENFATLSPQQKIERRASVQKLEDDVRQITRAAKNKEQQRFTLTVDEGQLNTLLQDKIDTSKFPIRDLRVGLQPNQLTLQGRIKLQSFRHHGHDRRQPDGAGRRAALRRGIAATRRHSRRRTSQKSAKTSEQGAEKMES